MCRPRCVLPRPSTGARNSIVNKKDQEAFVCLLLQDLLVKLCAGGDSEGDSEGHHASRCYEVRRANSLCVARRALACFIGGHSGVPSVFLFLRAFLRKPVLMTNKRHHHQERATCMLLPRTCMLCPDTTLRRCYGATPDDATTPLDATRQTFVCN
jgi:hypothetical protein